MKKLDLIGQTFGRLTVIERVPDKYKKGGLWRCKCECGNETIVITCNLTNCHTRSCGCLGKTHRITHGACKNGKRKRLYDIWINMRARCYSKTHVNYSSYGGRGISICKEWDSFESFEKWALSAGYDESAKRGAYTLDRIDVNGNYEPNNCRWISADKQNRNKRNTRNITYNGKTQCVAEWARELNLKPRTIYGRISRGITDPKALLGITT